MGRGRSQLKTATRNGTKRPGQWPWWVMLIATSVVAAAIAYFWPHLDSPRVVPEPRLKSSSTTPPVDFSQSQSFAKEGELVFLSVGGDTLAAIDIEIADTEQRRRRGLMHRQQMGEYEGMFFIFPRQHNQGFWMKNTPLPLDIIFVNSDLEVVTIAENTTPFAETTYPSTAPAVFVVEVNAGFSARHDLHVGATISWSRL